MGAVWITGALGFIGRHLAKTIAAAGGDVSGIGHGHWPAQQARNCGVTSWLNSDLTFNNLEVLQREAGRPQLIYHLAGGASVGASLENPRNDFSKTVDATSELLDWIRLKSPTTRLLAVSSAAVYGSSHVGPIRESEAARPYSPYGYHKYLMEELCRSYAKHYGINVVIVRLFSVFGPQLRKQLLWDICCKFQKATGSIVLGGTGGELRDWTDVRDVVRVLQLFSTRADDNAPTYNFGNGVGTSVKDVAIIAAEAWSELCDESNRIEFNGKARPGDPFSLVADVGRIHEIGVQTSISVNVGIQDYVRWFASTIKGYS